MIARVGRSLRRVVDALQRTLFDDEAVPLGSRPARPEPPPAALPPRANPPSATPPAVDRPPEGEGRVSRLKGRPVPWTLRRSRRRTIGFVVGFDGLVITAPGRTPLREIEAALQEKSRWVLARLDEQAERRTRAEAARPAWADGVTVPYLGAPMRVVLDADLDEATRFIAAAGDAVAVAVLRVALPADAAPERIRDAVQSWLQREATVLFGERCRHFETRLGVQVRSVRLSSAKTRWGSATSRGDIRLHWRLIQFTLPTIDYVVAHELAHLREMNHGPRFWSVVESVVPHHRAARLDLREASLRAVD